MMALARGQPLLLRKGPVMIAGASTSTVVDIPPRQEFALPAPHVLVSEADGVAAGLYHHPAPLQQQQQQQSLCISQRLLQQSPPRDAMWSRILRQLKLYQRSVLNDLPVFVARGAGRVDSGVGVTGSASIVAAGLQAAIKRMNTRVAHFYKERRRTTPTFEMMLELLQTQNRIIYQVLTIEQGLDLRNLYGTHSLKCELETRADDAFLVVQSSMPGASSGECAGCLVAGAAAPTHPEPPSYPCIPLGHGKAVVERGGEEDAELLTGTIRAIVEVLGASACKRKFPQVASGSVAADTARSAHGYIHVGSDPPGLDATRRNCPSRPPHEVQRDVEVWNHIYWGVRSYQVGILLALPEMIVAANASVFRGVEPDLVVVIRSLLKKTIQAFNKSVELARLHRAPTTYDPMVMSGLLSVLNDTICQELIEKLGLCTWSMESGLSLEIELKSRADVACDVLRANLEKALRRHVGDRETKGSSRCLDAFLVVLQEGYAGGEWYTSIKNLQLVSLQFCLICRGLPTARLRVAKDSPGSLWIDEGKDRRNSRFPPAKRRNVSRVPGFRARSMRWDLPFFPFKRAREEVFASVKTLVFGDDFNDHLPALEPLKSLETLVFGKSFNRTLEFVPLPSTLREVTFGDAFDQDIDDVVWPTTVQKLVFGDAFDRPLENATLPESLVQLTFGESFSRTVDGVRWPLTLQELTFGDGFNRALSGVEWPRSLRRLELGAYFDHPVDDVKLPPSLQELKFGYSFNHRIDRVTWPTTLRELTFGDLFNQDIRYVAWPAGLEKLVLGSCFNCPIDYIGLPASLVEISFGDSFDQALDEVDWPRSLRSLTFGDRFDQPIAQVIWPATLQKLGFGRRFKHCIGQGVLPKSLLRLDFGAGINMLLHGISWPEMLQEVTFAEGSMISLYGISWPATLQRVRFADMGVTITGETIRDLQRIPWCASCLRWY